MNIQAISSAMQTTGCQPLKNQSFAQAVAPDFSINDTDYGDVFTSSDPYTQEQKFDLACRVAAYYKTQYEMLQQKTGCYA